MNEQYTVDREKASLDYFHQHGFWLLQCAPKSKEPTAGYSWQKHSTSERPAWDSWLANGSNLAIDAAPSDLILIDIDVSKIGKADAWGAYVQLLAKMGIAAPQKPGDPFMPQTISASGGWHVYVRRPAHVRPEDIRGHGQLVRTSDVRPLADGEKNGEVIGFRNRGYCVAPPSYFDGTALGKPSGPYTLISNAPPHDCPDSFLEMLRLPAVIAPTGKAGESDCADVAGLVAFLDAHGEFDSEPDWFRALGAIKLACGDTDEGVAVALEMTTSTYDDFSKRWKRLSTEPRPHDYKLASLIWRARQLGFEGGVRKSASAMFRDVVATVADAPPLVPELPLPSADDASSGGSLMVRGGSLMGPRGEILPIDADESLALDFASEHADDLRYVEEMGRWLVWDGRRWRADKTSSAYYMVREHLRGFAGRMQFQEARKVASARTVAAIERMARTDPRIATEAAMWDCDPWLLNTPGGVVDLRTGIIRDARPSDHMTKITAAAPGGDCPTFKAFLHKSLAGDVELIAFVQRMLGYALTGDTREHALFFLFGKGGNGKGVLLNTVAHIMGDYQKTAPVDTFIDSQNERHPTDLAGLRGARLVTASETEKGRRWAEAKIKMLTGGDRISARFMRQDFFEFVPQFKLVIAGNHKPSLRSVDEAMRRRMHLIPFTVNIPESERDTSLQERLKAEWGGILAWIAEGCLAWQRCGLQPPAAVRAATDEYLSGEDVLGSWLDDRCEVSADAWAPRDALFMSWSGWATNAREFVGTAKQFYEAMRHHDFQEGKSVGVRGFRGVRLKSPPIVLPG